MLFHSIPGLTELKHTLVTSVSNRHIAHAQLFLGAEGSAALAMALAYVCYINCQQPNEGESCGQCVSCKQMQKLTHPDVHLVFPAASIEKVAKEDLKAHLTARFREFIHKNPFGGIQEWAELAGAENKQFGISVEEARHIIQQIAMRPYLEGFKVVLIWLPEYMNIAAANALLKSLEEPPAKTLFILVAQEYEKLLPTILSRCQMVKIPSFKANDIEYYLGRLNSESTELPISEIALLADGNMNKALQLLHNKPNPLHELLAKWLRLCYAHRYAELVLHCEDMAKIGREAQKSLLMYGQHTLRNCLVYRHKLTDLVKETATEVEFVKNLSNTVKDGTIEKLYLIFNEAYRHIERNGNAKIVLFDTSLQMVKALKA